MIIYNKPENFFPSYTFMKDWKKGDKAYYLETESNNKMSVYLVTLNNDSINPDGTIESHAFFIVDKLIVSTGDLFFYKKGQDSAGIWPTSFYYTDNSLYGTRYLTRAAIQHLFY